MRYLPIYLIFLFTSCSHSNDFLVINIQENILTQAGISAIAKKVIAIPLATNPDCLLGDIYSLRMSDSLLFVLSAGEIFLFDTTGRFLKKIISRGRGPGEIPSVRNFELDRNNKELIVLGAGDYVIRCKYDGTIVSQLRFKHSRFTIVDFSMVADSIWAICRGKSFEKNKSYDMCLLTLDKQLRILDSTSLYKPNMPPTLIGFGKDYFSVTGNNIFVNVPSLKTDRIRRDTLYRIDSGLQLVPALRLDFGYNDYRINASPFESGYPLDFEAIRISQRFLVVSYYDQKEEPFTFYTFCYDFYSGKKYNLKEGFNDDFYNTGNGLYLKPLDVYHNEYYYFRGTDELPSDYLPKRSESDNPILYIVTLKE